MRISEVIQGHPCPRRCAILLSCFLVSPFQLGSPSFQMRSHCKARETFLSLLRWRGRKDVWERQRSSAQTLGNMCKVLSQGRCHPLCCITDKWRGGVKHHPIIPLSALLFNHNRPLSTTTTTLLLSRLYSTPCFPPSPLYTHSKTCDHTHL